jgi:hypothetical protein
MWNFRKTASYMVRTATAPLDHGGFQNLHGLRGGGKYCAAICFFLCLLAAPLHGQFAPGAGEPGTTAIPADSSIFINWATQCSVDRGPQDITAPELGLATAGEADDGTGPSDGRTVSLGDGGTATLTFEYPVADGPGWDFAVFENGFSSFGGYFLELATVAVSSDGINFVPFPDYFADEYRYAAPRLCYNRPDQNRWTSREI